MESFRSPNICPYNCKKREFSIYQNSFLSGTRFNWIVLWFPHACGGYSYIFSYSRKSYCLILSVFTFLLNEFYFIILIWYEDTEKLYVLIASVFRFY